MERIQSALAKARAAREGKAGSTTKAAALAAANDEIWSAVTAFNVDPSTLAANRIVAHQSGGNSASFDIMRTTLLRQLRANGWSRVAITSPTAGCGKSTVALNLAFSLSRLADIKVLVVELDIRRPAMLRMLGIAPGPDFASSLARSEVDFSQMRRLGTNLAFCLTSRPVESASELLSAPRTAEIIDEIEAQLRPTVILFDTSPVLSSDDTIAFLDQVDCALMVAAAEETTSSEIEQVGRELARHTQVLGVILNKCRYADGQEGYGAAE